MVCIDVTVVSIKVGSKVFHCPYNTEGIKFCYSIVLFMSLESPAGKC